MKGYAVDYGGRQFDIELLQHIEIPERQRVRPAADHGGDGSGPRLVAGMEKVVQRYANLFLTDLGSVKFMESVGGEVVSSLRSGTVWSRGYLSVLCSLANVSAVSAMRESDSDESLGGQPPDERISSASATVEDVDVSTGTVKISVVIETEAGSDYTFVIPVKSGVS